MATSVSERTDILELVALLFDAAPGANNLAALTSLYEALGHDLAALAIVLGNTAVFTTIHPNFETAEEFADTFLGPIGLQNDATAHDWVVAQFNAGAPKASIIYAAWDILNDLPASYGPLYQAAKAAMENKAQVAEYYSVVLGQSSSSLPTLQHVLDGVGADEASVAAAIAAIDNIASTGPNLTPGQDILNILGSATTVITGLVDADADGNTANGTLTAGDRITGNGHTTLELTVLEGGDTGFTRIDKVEAIAIHAATSDDVAFNAAAWTHVGSVQLSSGIDGMEVFLDNLQGGTQIGVMDVTGAISASYDTDEGNLHAWLRNKDEGGAGGTLSASAIGDVLVNLADSVSATISNTTGVALGDVTVTGGDNSFFSAEFDTSNDMSVGDVAITLGEVGVAKVVVVQADGDYAAGATTLVAGDQSVAVLGVHEVSGTVNAGGISISFGDASNVSASFDSIDGAATVGNVSATVGDDSTLVAAFSAIMGGATVGDVTLTAGDDASANLNASAVTGSISLGDVAIAAGSGASAGATFLMTESMDDVSAGAVSTTVGDSGSAAIVVVNTSGIHFGDMTQAGGDSSTVSMTLSVNRDRGDIVTGNIDMTAGDESFASIQLQNAGDNAGGVTVGNLTGSIGDNARANFILTNAALDEPTEDNTGNSVGDMSVGNITVSAGDVIGIGGQSSIQTAVLYGGKSAGATAGDFSFGDFDLSIGNGYVSGTQEMRASINLQGLGSGAESLGDGSVGDIALAGGDFASFNVGVGGLLLNSVNGTMGQVVLGNTSVTAGESALIQLTSLWGALDADVVGAMEQGDIDVLAAQDARLALSVQHGVTTGAATSVGSMRLGDVHAVLGDNAVVSGQILDLTRYGNQESDLNGDLDVGDITVSVSATETQDLSGGSSIQFAIGKQVQTMGLADAGDFTVGDVALSAGDTALIALELTYSGGAAALGDMTVGAIDIAAGADSNVTALVAKLNQAEGDLGDVSVGGMRFEVGDDSTAHGAVSVAHNSMAGDLGNLSLGGIAMDLGKGAEGLYTLVAALTPAADVGDYAVGNVSLMLADDATADLQDMDIAAVIVGDVSVGGFEALLGDGAEARFDVDVHAVASVGGLSAGDVNATVGEGGLLSYSLEVVAGTSTGDLSFGNVSMDLGADAYGSLSVKATAAGGELGAVSVGDIDLTLGVGAQMPIGGFNFIADTMVGLTAGDVTIHATDGSLASFGFELLAAHLGDVVIGDVDLSVADDTSAGGTVHFHVTAMGSANDDLTVGNVTLDVAGTADADEIWMQLSSNGDVHVGDLTVSGKGAFSFFGAAVSGDPNTSFLDVQAGGDVSIGNVDFSGFAGNAQLDLSWTDAGAGRITGGAGNDAITGNAQANVITGGKGIDTIDLTHGGNDTVVTNKGDSGNTAVTLDAVTGFAAGHVASGALSGGDKLDFNLAAGTAGNYVERSANFTTFDEFLSNANSALNSSVTYFVQDNGTDTFVAVNYGSGEADVIIVLSGVSDATTLQYQNFIA